MVQDALQPKYKQVSRRILRCDCLKLWKKDKEELINGFESLQTGINIITDERSAPHNCPESYICVTASWVNLTTWQMMKRTIVFKLFNYPHTDQNLFNILTYVFQTFKIEKQDIFYFFRQRIEQHQCGWFIEYKICSDDGWNFLS